MNIKHTVHSLTSGSKHHFFGYYDVCPWNVAATHLLGIESDFQDHLPHPQEAGLIGLIDATTGKFEGITETYAWNLQQGTMLNWNPLNPDTEFIHNDRLDGEIISVIHNISTGNRRLLPRPISALSRNGHYALSLTYGRLQRMRKVVGYTDTLDPNPTTKHPDNDGVFLIDMESGTAKLVVSIKDVFEYLVDKHPFLKEKDMWFNHVGFNPSATRFFFLARCWEDGQLQTGLFTANLDGSGLSETVPFGTRVSHFTWYNNEQIVFTSNYRGQGREHVIVTDGVDDFRLLAENNLNFDGHMTFSPNREWMVTDKNVSESLEKWLILMRYQDEAITVLHRFNMQETQFFMGELRCDLHPRWNREGNKICVDALNADDGTRQIHVIHLDLP